MVIDEIIARLKEKFPEAEEYLDKLIIDSSAGEVEARWEWGLGVGWPDVKLHGPNADEMVLGDLRLLIVDAYHRMGKLALAMGVSEGDLQ